MKLEKSDTTILNFSNNLINNWISLFFFFLSTSNQLSNQAFTKYNVSLFFSSHVEKLNLFNIIRNLYKSFIITVKNSHGYHF